jgi:hypothetical protein
MICMPMTISNPAMAGMATFSTWPAKSSTNPATKSPTRILAQRDFAPVPRTMAVPPSDPPSGRPRKRPETMLAMPCAEKSRDASP